MIRSLTIKDGLLHDLLGPRTIHFEPDINIIWGKNGVGKSSIIKTLAHYSSIHEGTLVSGFSSTQHMELRFDDTEKESSIEEIIDSKSKKGRCDIVWDGKPTVYLSIEERAGKSNMKNQTSIDELRGKDSEYYTDKALVQSLLSQRESFYYMTSGMSSGENIILFLNKLSDITLPDLTRIPFNNRANEAQRAGAQKFVEYIKKKPRDQKPTLLLDEPDRNLDYENQYNLHVHMIPSLAEKFQVIVVSHSPFAFMQSRNIIDLDGTANTAKSLYGKLHEIWRSEHAEEE